MKTLYRLGWPLTFLGLVVILASTVFFMHQDTDLERQGQIASDQWRTRAVETIAGQRARLTVWPGVFIGAAVTALGIVLLDLRRRGQAGLIDREDMERRFEGGRPVGFKPSEPESDSSPD